MVERLLSLTFNTITAFQSEPLSTPKAFIHSSKDDVAKMLIKIINSSSFGLQQRNRLFFFREVYFTTYCVDIDERSTRVYLFELVYKILVPKYQQFVVID